MKAKPGTKIEVAGGIWKAPCISQQPILRLIRWSVRQVESGSRHLVGFNVADHEGRVSTAIQTLDPTTAQVTTRSGRIYELVGPPGCDKDAEWVWQKITSSNLKWFDATEEIDKALKEKGPK